MHRQDVDGVHTPLECAKYLGTNARECFRPYKIAKEDGPKQDFERHISVTITHILTPEAIKLASDSLPFAIVPPEYWHEFFKVELSPRVKVQLALRQNKPPIIYVPATPFLAQALDRAVSEKEGAERLALARSLLDVPSLAGHAFEIYAIDRIVQDGLKLKRPDSNINDEITSSEYQLHRLSTTDFYDAPLAPGALYVVPPNHATFDAFLITNDAKHVIFIQVTIARKHSTNPRGFVTIKPRIDAASPNTPIQRYDFVYAVPTEETGKALLRLGKFKSGVWKVNNMPDLHMSYVRIDGAHRTAFVVRSS